MGGCMLEVTAIIPSEKQGQLFLNYVEVVFFFLLEMQSTVRGISQ